MLQPTAVSTTTNDKPTRTNVRGLEIAHDGTNPGDGAYTATYLDAALRPLRNLAVTSFVHTDLPPGGGAYRIVLPWAER